MSHFQDCPYFREIFGSLFNTVNRFSPKLLLAFNSYEPPRKGWQKVMHALLQKCTISSHVMTFVWEGRPFSKVSHNIPTLLMLRE